MIAGRNPAAAVNMEVTAAVALGVAIPAWTSAQRQLVTGSADPTVAPYRGCVNMTVIPIL
jgi:hypothetical protein